ncbi:flavin reductase family protein [Burkholderia lata]|uniref:flavin reductase family protein n=1 Tax=Burkholderia lata (strain ATCC 17760 / DSM 23089 / LMG 22485 / NCIMB 9086 / R18194 / 383) TaxID=482957 RepID=UPI001581D26C|nr:flavin reductase family protein [Burkholderia lata]
MEARDFCQRQSVDASPVLSSATGQELRAAFGCYPTGVTIVTCRCPDTDHFIGVTANSFTSVSLDPPIVSWNLGSNAHSRSAFSNAREFAIHVLSAQQQELARRFATRGASKFEGVLLDSETPPLFNQFLVRYVCRKIQQISVGDHEVFFGEVVRLDTTAQAPLMFVNSQFVDCALVTR